jgi:rhamnosyl/mannosyltransferase
MNPRQVRILQVGKFYPPYPGGMETHLEQLCVGLQRYANVRVIVANTSRHTIAEQLAGVPVLRTGTMARFAGASVSPGMAAAIRNSPADIVHIHWPNPTAVLAYFASGHAGRLVLTYHSDVVRQKLAALFFNPIFHRLMSRCSAVIATSHRYIETSPFLRRYRKLCHVIPFGVCTKRFTSPDDAAVEHIRRKYGPRLVLSIGRLVYYKGFEYLIQAMRSVNGRALIIGDGPLRGRLQKLAVSYGVANRVVVMGEYASDLVSYLHAADVFVLPSIARSEAFGIVQLEAMACGIPVVNTTLDSGAPFVSLHGITGLSVPPADSRSLAMAINELLDDASLRARYGEAGRKRVAQEFTVERMIHRTCRVYDQVLESSGLIDIGNPAAPQGGYAVLSNTQDETPL